MNMKYSFIVPVFNRPDEVDELLESLCHQEVKDFEVIIVEDGSQKPCKDVCDKYADILDLHYYYKENSGPGQSRNYGVERAQGEYVIVLDSDVVLPNGYLEATNKSLTSHLSPLTSHLSPLTSHLYSSLGRSRCCPSVIHARAEGHQLFHDVFLYYGRHTWRKGKARQVLSPLVQYGHSS